MKRFMCKVLHKQLSLFWIVMFSCLHCVSICKMGMLSWLWGLVCVSFFKNMFVTLFDFQNQFLFVLWGYVYVLGFYFLLFVFFKSMFMSWGSTFFCLSIFLAYVCVYLCLWTSVFIFEGLCLSMSLKYVWVYLCHWMCELS